MTDRTIEYWLLADVIGAERNPKGHDDVLIADSIERFGYIEPVQLDERTGRLIAGHGRLDNLKALEARKVDPPDGIAVDGQGAWLLPVVRGWSSLDDAHAAAALLTLNRGVERGGWNEAGVAEILAELIDVDTSLVEVSGYTRAHADQLIADNTPPDHSGDGGMLDSVDVTYGEPVHTVEHGEVWGLGPLHTLVVADVLVEHERWVHRLVPGVIFLPYGGPYIALSEKGHETPLLIVQPDPYIAGHALDKYAAIHGEDSLVRMEP